MPAATAKPSPPLCWFGLFGLLKQLQACPSVDGSAGIGPTLAGLYGTTRPLADGSTVVADEDYLLESIVNPMAKIAEGYQPVMPAMFSSTLSPKQLDGLVAYIKTLE